jgi:hypothetical protein
MVLKQQSQGPAADMLSAVSAVSYLGRTAASHGSSLVCHAACPRGVKQGTMLDADSGQPGACNWPQLAPVASSSISRDGVC